MTLEAQNRQAEREIALEAAAAEDRQRPFRQRPAAEADRISSHDLGEDAAHPKELKSFQIGGADSLGAMIGSLMKVIESMAPESGGLRLQSHSGPRKETSFRGGRVFLGGGFRSGPRPRACRSVV